MNHILPFWLSLPFIFLLVAISLGPNLLPKLWHRVENYFLVIVCAFSLIGLYSQIDLTYTLYHLTHTLEMEYIPFIVLIYTLYTIGTGLKITIHGSPTPLKNALFLFLGGILSNLVGTTGASMLLIHPFIKWNKDSPYKMHLVVFFIFIVSNIGGSLTPIGDAPLFIGYLQGVPFFWTLQNLWQKSFLAQFIILSIFIIIDHYKNGSQDVEKGKFKTEIIGKEQLLLIPLVIFILVTVDNAKTALFLKEVLLLGIAFISYTLDRRKNRFLSKKAHWSPVWEVARVFLTIFVSLIPISIMLKNGEHGVFASILKLANEGGKPNNVLYYWFSGLFSAVLDNAPTYLLFYKMVGASSAEQMILMFEKTLIAISISCVFFGSITYIGNAPNFMVRNIAKQHHVEVPSFLGFIGWSIAILFPIFFLIQIIFI
jgi:Na+/H+ antiporter NhaD/arsenite permease-like protein